MMLMMCQTFINVLFISHQNGKQDETLISGIGMGFMFVEIMVTAPAKGLNSALETLVSQAFGAGELTMCGVYLNRGRLIFSVYFLVALIVIINADRILSFLGQD